MSDYNKYTYWIEMSEYDIETAKAMLETKRYLYVGFMCHQAIEKSLKAVFVRDCPPEMLPFIHNLAKIAEKSGIYVAMTDTQKDFMDELEPLNIEARYPEAKDRLLVRMTQDYCADLLKRTEEMITWLKEN
jgi:HEPN domain-containing protein